MSSVFYTTWAKLIIKYSWIALLILLFAWIAVFAYCWFFLPFPSFDEPLLGFEARGTQLSDKINTWKLFVKSRDLTMYPFSGSNWISGHKPGDSDEQLRREESEEPEIDGTRAAVDEGRSRNRTHFADPTGMFCGTIMENHVQIVLESRVNMLTLDVLRTICRLDRDVLRLTAQSARARSVFSDVCEIKATGGCCNSWSLPNYAAAMSNKTSCFDLTESDLNNFTSLLQACWQPYKATLESPMCVEESKFCGNVSENCQSHEQLLFPVFHFLVGSDSAWSGDELKITLSNVFLPAAKAVHLHRYFDVLETLDLALDDVKVVGMDLGLKYAVFEKLLLNDSKYLAVATAIIICLLCLYTKSILVAVFMVLTVVGSLVFSYFIYDRLYSISFFPFMNFVAVVICIAIGSDNGLVFCRYWSNLNEKGVSVDRTKMLAYALKSTTISTSIASFTTSAAFISSYFTNITAIKCFSIFSATMVLVNLLLTLWAIPAAVIASECFTSYGTRLSTLQKFIDQLKLARASFASMSARLLDSVLRYSVLVFALSNCFVVISIIFILNSSTMITSSEEEVQLLRSDHLFEKYDLIYKDKFNFLNRSYLRSHDDGLPIWIVIGVQPNDNGNHLDPYSRGSLVYHDNFITKLSQHQDWLLRLCRSFKNQSFYRPALGPQLTNCFMETLHSWMSGRDCFDDILETNRFPCCKNSSFPYQADVLDLCVREAVKLTSGKSRGYISSTVAGVWYSRSSLNLTAIVLEYGVHSYSFQLISTLNDWLSKQSSDDHVDAWLIVDGLEKTALHEAMVTGTYWSVALTLSLACLTSMVATMDWFLILLTGITTLSIMSCTVGALIALGWSLNIVECVCISMTIGLSLDSILHYVVAYKLNHQSSKRNRTLHAFNRMSIPVFVANLTTFVTGLVLLFANVLPYVQFGKFLITISVFGWSFSTALFLCMPRKILKRYQLPSRDTRIPMDALMQTEEPSREVLAN